MAGAIFNPKPTATPAMPASLSQAIPGLDNLTSTATSNITNLLNGLPSPSIARTANAYWGVGAGQPGTGGVGTFIGNRGADLYGQQAQANQQTGLQDLLGLVGGYSGTVAPTAGQNLQNSQFYANLGQQGGEFQQSNALAQFQAMLQALGMGANVVNQGRQQLPQLAFNL